jgi:hypothetical protein
MYSQDSGCSTRRAFSRSPNAIHGDFRLGCTGRMALTCLGRARAHGRVDARVGAGALAFDRRKECARVSADSWRLKVRIRAAERGQVGQRGKHIKRSHDLLLVLPVMKSNTRKKLMLEAVGLDREIKLL